MFTGIIETLGVVKKINKEGSNLNLWLSCGFISELKIDQSVAHDGVCLTVVNISDKSYQVTAVEETIEKTSLKTWGAGKQINLERAMLLGSRLDGHIVQGHVDTTGICIKIEDLEGSFLFTFSFPEEFAPLIIEKGSICVNGVSLTAFDCGETTFSVTIIPYTWEYTNFQHLKVQEKVNLEFDVLGKYILRNQQFMTQ